jgi:hypothetical protein
LSVRALLKLGIELGLTVILGGCVLSGEPVILESDATFDQRLLGMWEEVSGSDHAVVSRAAENTYAIDISDGWAGSGDWVGWRPAISMSGPRPATKPKPAPASLSRGFNPPLMSVRTDPHVGTRPIRLQIFVLARSDGTSVDRRQAVLPGTTRVRSALAPCHPGLAGGVGLAARATGPRLGEFRLPASAWREADQIFHRDLHWLGADVASTVDLGGRRILWLFGDTWIDPSGAGARRGARMVSNSVAIQTGTDPTTASMTFYWGKTPDGRPDALFPDQDGESLWFGNGVRVGNRLVLFFGHSATLANWL